ncbi:glycosyltransferase [Hymenobacter sp. BT664]|uniref:Glycosyltransferase n=1 Tax=Hymenobacter montanus TaxID=2771359 RepID=A0A927BG22_9BACT|nr:glycosyltransferase family 4 protein [Hymenobacter montanus]MBD2769519.1 glycosyltransferase [Hymenobacter montanus]
MLPTTPTDFSVLLLAWDDADPKVAVLGGSALPPTLPLVYQLATHQSVVALYPHLPTESEAAARPTPETATPIAAAPNPKAPPSATTTDALPVATTAGVRLLPEPAATVAGAAAPMGFRILSSRIIGLDDLAPDRPSPLPGALLPPPALSAAAPPPASRSQWPTGADAPSFFRAQVPAAPYVGACFEPTPGPSVHSLPATVEGEAAEVTLEIAPSVPAAQVPTPAAPPSEQPAAEASTLAPDPGPELLPVAQPTLFAEPTDEPGPAEAIDLLASEDNITPDAPLVAIPTAAPAPAAEPQSAPPAPSEPVPLRPALDGLNYRMIQYARQAAQLVRGHTSFGVIYAPNWPAWLAALEIRNSTGRPLVVYAAGLAADFGGPAERGWLLEVERMTLRRARVILVPDESLRYRLQEQYGATIAEVRVVPAADEPAVQRVLSEVSQ